MVRTVGVIPVSLLLFLPLRATAAPHGAKTRYYKFIITTKGQPWLEIQSQVNGNTAFHYTCCSENYTQFSVSDMKANVTGTSIQQTEHLKYVMEELQKKLLEYRANMTVTTDPLSLEGSMTCWQESNGRTNACWEFGFHGQMSLSLNAKNSSWKVLRDEGITLKKILDSNGAITHLLVRTAAGDCVSWLEQVLFPQDEVLETKAAPTMAPATAAPTRTPARGHSKATPRKHIACILSWIIFIFIFIIGILCWICYGNRPTVLPRRPR